MLQIFQIVFPTSISDFNPPFISDLSQNCPNSCLQQSLHHDKLVSLLTIIIIFAQYKCWFSLKWKSPGQISLIIITVFNFTIVNNFIIFLLLKKVWTLLSSWVSFIAAIRRIRHYGPEKFLQWKLEVGSLFSLLAIHKSCPRGHNFHHELNHHHPENCPHV